MRSPYGIWNIFDSPWNRLLANESSERGVPRQHTGTLTGAVN